MIAARYDDWRPTWPDPEHEDWRGEYRGAWPSPAPAWLAADHEVDLRLKSFSERLPRPSWLTKGVRIALDPVHPTVVRVGDVIAREDPTNRIRPGLVLVVEVERDWRLPGVFDRGAESCRYPRVYISYEGLGETGVLARSPRMLGGLMRARDADRFVLGPEFVPRRHKRC